MAVAGARSVVTVSVRTLMFIPDALFYESVIQPATRGVAGDVEFCHAHRPDRTWLLPAGNCVRTKIAFSSGHGLV
jgi:hypothetical protein